MKKLLLPAVLILMPMASPLVAETLFFSGDLRTNATFTTCDGMGCSLVTDGDYAQWAAVVYDFTVFTPTSMEAVTYSYAGGTSLSGHTVAAGGLEPYLSLFDSSGNFLDSTYFGITCPAGAQTLNGNCFDVELDGGTLQPGTYQIALSAYANMSFAENQGTGTLADGFTGLGNLAQGEDLNYAFDVILPGNVLPTPEPGTVGTLAAGLVALSIKLRRKK